MERKTDIIYYTCNTHLEKIDDICRKQLLKAGLPIVSVSLNKNLDFGNERILVEGKRSPEMMHKQILVGLQASDADYVFLCESDVLYHPSHFEIVPERKDRYYVNENVWKLLWGSDKCIWTDNMRQVSGICADRKLLLDFYTRRNKEIEEVGFDRHYEPPHKLMIPWMSKEPLICIRHDSNITRTKMSPEDFRNERNAKGWKDGKIPNWGKGLI